MKKWIIITVLAMAATIVSAQKEKWYQIGFKVGTQFPIVHNYSDVDYLTGTRTVHFGGYFRAGKYVFGEIGFGYQYFKNRFKVDRKSTRLNSSHTDSSRMPSSA